MLTACPTTKERSSILRLTHLDNSARQKLILKFAMCNKQ